MRQQGAASRVTKGVAVEVLDRQRSARPPLRRIRTTLREAGRLLGVRGEVTLIFAGDGTLRRLNGRYRHKDSTTDVLSFEGPGGLEGLGDVVISVAAARRNARQAGRPLGQELEVLALHGFLHVLGHDHETDDGTMERLERRLRRRLIGCS